MIKDTLKLVLIFLTGALALTGAWHLFHKEKINAKNEIITRSDTTRIVLHDTLWYHLAGRIKKTDSVFIPVPAKVDTAEILKRYFAKISYVDTLKNSALIAVIADTISENKILSRNFSYKILKPEIIQSIVNTSVLPEIKTKFFIGAFVSGNTNTFGIGAQAVLLTKSERLYNINYDVQNKIISAGLAWKIHL